MTPGDDPDSAHARDVETDDRASDGISGEPADAADTVDVIVAVPPGSHRPDALIAAVTTAHPMWSCRAVWAGDPQLRPPAGGTGWLDVDIDEGDLLRVEADALPWLVALTAIRDADVARPTIVVVCGAIAALGRLDALVASGDSMIVVPKLLHAPTGRDRHPTPDVLAEEGSVSASVVSFGPDARSTVEWLLDQVVVPSALDLPVDVGRLLELAAQFFASDRCTDELIGASVWRWPDGRPSLIDLPHYDDRQPWLADPTLDGPPHVSLGDPDRVHVLGLVAPQLAGTTDSLRLPGGIAVDKPIRRIARGHYDLPARPWSDAAAFRAWLHRQYWDDLHRERPDLQVVFPHPTGIDADRFSAWARRAAFDGDAPLLIEPGVLPARSSIERTGQRRDGVNLVGYFKHQSGVSNVGRRVAGILDRHGVPYTTVAYERTWSPPIVPAPVCDQRIDYVNSLAFVNGDQFGYLHHDIPELFGEGQQVVGLWSWELETLDGAAPTGHAHVDQIWGTTTFMADSFRSLGVPVHHVHVPFTEPVSSGRERSSFPPLAEADDRFVFGVVLDHLSITARKNPVGAIRAFRRAFAPDGTREGPVLVIKTINARTCWTEHERLLVEAAGQPDIVVWDEHLPIGDHIALIASFDAVVSLHRSEGVGLHLAEAMWLERPIIATNYSGNLDFMDADSAMLIDADMVPVGDLGDGGWAYPPAAMWAEPDIADAADAMRRLVDDPGLATKIGTAARAKMLSMPGEDDFIKTMKHLLDLDL